MQSHFDIQTLRDLEFDEIRQMLAGYCHSPTARTRAEQLEPSALREKCIVDLHQTDEFLHIRSNGLSFPRLEFKEIHRELGMLGLKGSSLQAEAFVEILRITELSHEIIAFFHGSEEGYLHLRQVVDTCQRCPEVVTLIRGVFDDKGKIRNDASPELAEIRSSMETIRRKINRNFSKVLKDLKVKGWLADTNEAFVNDRRVLSVLSGHKRQVKGHILGSSKTGNWTFIEPAENIELNFELEQLQDDEVREIRRILTELTGKVSRFKEELALFQSMLLELDFINARARLAAALEASMPQISGEMEVDLIDAYHPILFLANKKLGIRTIPQTLRLDKFNRMLVISGPNAGGKSITLKTVGLLQLMLQSGLLVPCDERSTFSVFHAILTDIGDNQSIENQLSTYSYRLKRMKSFLEIANKRTLLLLDEFGTGSDPELGGALAEVFFEALYSKKSFGVITTHYSNIKMKAAQLRNAVNGCMLFDRESLEPLYQLSIGQPGSSFTFEVAEINGIDHQLIAQAKEKLDDRKVQLDRMIADLQREKGKVSKLNLALEDAEQAATKAREQFERRRDRYDERLNAQQQLVDKNNDLLSRGKKMQQFIREFDTRKAERGNKPLLNEIRDYLLMEKSRMEEDRIKSEIKQKAQKKQKERKDLKDNIARIAVGTTVKLATSKQHGEVLELDNGVALVAFGVFKTRVEVHKLRYVKG
ncbi:MAG: DNA mismatch repair protein MutS [Flavobacteriales bacterium]|nr:DNA mismatch repair protein MutS [Flavobacteriales bacterium]